MSRREQSSTKGVATATRGSALHVKGGFGLSALCLLFRSRAVCKIGGGGRPASPRCEDGERNVNEGWAALQSSADPRSRTTRFEAALRYD